MRKPHWESVKLIHDTVRSSAKYIRIEGPGAGIGPISDSACLRRIDFVRRTSGQDVKTAAELSGKFAYSGEEMVGDRCPIPGLNPEWVHAGAFSSYVMFAKGGERIYKIGREFGEVLAKADLDVRAELVPETQDFICVEFPDHLRFHDPNYDDYFHCAYLAVQKTSPAQNGKSAFEPVDRRGNKVHCVVSIMLPCYDADGKEREQENNTTLCFLNASDTISSSLERAQEASSHPISCPEVFEYLMKFLIYLGSGEPDLREYRAPRPKTENPKKLKRWHREHENRSLVDMTLVGFSWKKPRVYSVGETTVTGHPRWQPYGPRRERVKLIWIEPHVRHYGAKENDE